ncbi:MAG: ATP-dependent DNA helicase RecG [Clostridia bacterium]|nr:ATP-dependent DNA helicase RecG [Clostridia bacterium]
MSNLNTDIRFLKGVGEKRAEKLYSMGIDTFGALLRFYPRAYQDLSKITKIFDCVRGEKVCVKAKVTTPVKEQYIRQNMTVYRFDVSDDSGVLSVTVFNNKFLANSLKVDREYLFYGKISENSFSLSMSSPEILGTSAMGIRPVYSTASGITSKMIEKMVKPLLLGDIGEDTLPLSVRESYKLCDLKTALLNIHFPKSTEALQVAKRRLVFEELFILQTGLMLLKGKKKANTDFIVKYDFSSEFQNLLPFKMTNAQTTAINDCIKDMSSGRAMNRLIEGDVGSGKTAVAVSLMYTMAKNGFQSVLMAPTEILAEQHFKTVSGLLENSGLNYCLLTGSTTKSNKEKIKLALKNGDIDIAIGTHALISDDVEFNNLGLVITDEQHRFGVGQRAKLAGKGEKPHTLVMSATPIPRTLGLIIYGDLDISIINEYPKGRQQIESYLVTSKLRQRVYGYIKKHLDEGRQGYIVCPLVEESEDTPLISAERYYNSLKSGKFKDYRVGLLHGKMNSKEKETVMHKFKDGEIQLLICTTVIEVGIDVPNATIMVIENAERFGLSQLHQLRGRIGRGSFKSTCIFISDLTSGSTAERLNVIKSSTDGFKIADEDLKLRGPGDFLGNRQHGLPQLKIADISSDIDILRLSGMAAANLLEKDPKLKAEDCIPLRKEIISLYIKLNEN